MTLAEIAAVTGGEVHGDPDVVVDAPATLDSRAVEAGGLFVAIAGEHVDGHAYAEAAVAAGAAAVLGTRPTTAPTVVVADAVAALGTLARHVLDRLPDVTVLALTGSQGKTGTKDYLAAILADAGPTVATAGNLNNELGVPLTVLRATPRRRTSSSRWAHGTAATSPTCARSRRRGSPPSSTSAPPTSASSVSRAAIARPRARSSRRSRPTARRVPDGATRSPRLGDRTGATGAHLRASEHGRRQGGRRRARRPRPLLLHARPRRREAARSGCSSPATTRSLNACAAAAMARRGRRPPRRGRRER